MSTSIKPYLKHPVLVNPTRWITANKVHASNLYRKGFYDSGELDHNPFGRALVDTKADGFGTRFPVGSMIHLTADTPPDKRQSSDYWIMPIINNSISLDQFYFTSHYMINSEVYVNHMVRQGKKTSQRFLPKKIVHRNGKTGRGETVFMPEFSEVVIKRYEQGIVKLLKTREAQAPTAKNEGPGLKLTKKGSMFNIVGSEVTVNVKKLCQEFDFNDDELFIPYEQNDQLCDLIIYYVNYKLDSN